MKPTIEQLMTNEPLLQNMKELKHIFWINPNKGKLSNKNFHFKQVIDAEKRLERFSSYISVAFPETTYSKGLIESNLKEINSMKKLIEGRQGITIPGKLFLKCDHELPISGSIKARGGIYEVLKFAEQLALEHGLITLDDDYKKFHSDKFFKFFQNYKIAVGSTGNLGLSIGIIGAKLGFQVTVHMSSDAKEWKKRLLREKGVEVIEYTSDYSTAVEEGRKQAMADSKCHFVDDENSTDLFAGYAVAAIRLKEQLKQIKITVDSKHPLFVYLPCGVGGAPGGIAYGLKEMFGEDVHIFFGEPLQSPCMSLGLMTGLHDEISVFDLGLTNTTEADGLAVGRPSKFVGEVMEPIVSGCYTVDDHFLFRSLKAMYENENVFMEPSAHAAVFGPIALMKYGSDYIQRNHLQEVMDQGTHLLWSTGGNMVPPNQIQAYLQQQF